MPLKPHTEENSMKRFMLLKLASATLVLGTVSLVAARPADAAPICSFACILDSTCAAASKACGPTCPVGDIRIDGESCPEGYLVDCTFDGGLC